MAIRQDKGSGGVGSEFRRGSAVNPNTTHTTGNGMKVPGMSLVHVRCHCRAPQKRIEPVRASETRILQRN